MDGFIVAVGGVVLIFVGVMARDISAAVQRDRIVANCEQIGQVIIRDKVYVCSPKAK